jgi:hypothetical protein
LGLFDVVDLNVRVDLGSFIGRVREEFIVFVQHMFEHRGQVELGLYWSEVVPFIERERLGVVDLKNTSRVH